MSSAVFGATYCAFAPFVSDTDSTALPVYGTLTEFAELAKADLAVTNTKGEMAANNKIAISAEEFYQATLTIDSTELELEKQAIVYGATYDEDNDELVKNITDVVPYGMLGYIKTYKSSDGTVYYRAVVMTKARAAIPSDTATTKGSSITFTPKTTVFTCEAPACGDWTFDADFATEALAKAYIADKATESSDT